mmetsp:Transcript_7557/g.19368  ORF Transcript_7557/g.19368 Transcript_7557/m.19368 type:complete len:224 (-) Transcript_7557:2-673(-)
MLCWPVVAQRLLRVRPGVVVVVKQWRQRGRRGTEAVAVRKQARHLVVVPVVEVGPKLAQLRHTLQDQAHLHRRLPPLGSRGLRRGSRRWRRIRQGLPTLLASVQAGAHVLLRAAPAMPPGHRLRGRRDLGRSDDARRAGLGGGDAAVCCGARAGGARGREPRTPSASRWSHLFSSHCIGHGAGQISKDPALAEHEVCGCRGGVAEKAASQARAQPLLYTTRPA